MVRIEPSDISGPIKSGPQVVPRFIYLAYGGGCHASVTSILPAALRGRYAAAGQGVSGLDPFVWLAMSALGLCECAVPAPFGPVALVRRRMQTPVSGTVWGPGVWRTMEILNRLEIRPWFSACRQARATCVICSETAIVDGARSDSAQGCCGDLAITGVCLSFRAIGALDLLSHFARVR